MPGLHLAELCNPNTPMNGYLQQGLLMLPLLLLLLLDENAVFCHEAGVHLQAAAHVRVLLYGGQG